MDWIDKQVKDGRIKFAICDYSKCESKEIQTLYRVNDKHICGTCLDKIENKLNLLGVWVHGKH